ncbi:MAG TPA: hypothetical protein VK471_05430 [Solirubrobacterales bacterium]|nr:hypothetical protein [Solirubrobacterales bacterium]
MAVSAALTCVFVVAATPAHAAEDSLHAFNAPLSLTGGCQTFAPDPVPDPDCPYPAPPSGPSAPFALPTGIAVDSYGDVYVASRGPQGGHEGRIDVFDAEGHFISEIPEPNGPQNLAVDSEGYLYAWSYEPGQATALRRYDPEPSSYDPPTGEIDYNSTPTIIAEIDNAYAALAINPEDNHLFVNYGSRIAEYGSAAEGNTLLNPEVASLNSEGYGLAIDAAHGLIYATDGKAGGSIVIKVFELASPHGLVRTIDGSTTPDGRFLTRFLSGAVDEATGHLFVYDSNTAHVIYEFDEDGEYLGSIEYGFLDTPKQIAVDNGAYSPNGAENPEGRYLWVTSSVKVTEGHAFAFGPSAECAPTVESVSVSHLGETEALLGAEIEPCNLQTSYRLEYVSQQQYDESGFEGARLAGEGTIAAGNEPVKVLAGATGLSPGTSYLFRAVATNELGSGEEQTGFTTYPPAGIATGCPNASLRTGPSALLPDCRAYELVTPSDTNAHPPLGLTALAIQFATRQASPDGNRLSFLIQGGVLPGFEGTGSFAGDPYLTTRGASGWSTQSAGPDGSEAFAAQPGSASPDQGYRFWIAEGGGSAVLGPNGTNYLRYPDGHSEVLGRGSLATDYKAQGKLIAENGAHVLYTSEMQLEEGAKPSGLTIYDRTTDGVNHVVSLLPGDIAPTGTVVYRGASLDGRGVAFAVFPGDGHSTLYLRQNDGQTHEIGEDVTFEGIAEGGGRIFYLEGGDLYAFDTEAGTIPFTTGGDATVVNVAADGTAAYFVSPDKLTNAPNPLGAKAKTGQENLYLSREGAIDFVGAVTERDVEGERRNYQIGGLGLWVENLEEGGLASDPSRSTADGGVLLFESRAALTGYDSESHAEVYRYDAGAPSLTCVSCSPTGTSATSDAKLQTINVNSLNETTPLTVFDVTPNLSPDGRRAFFETSDPLVASDIDGRQDVYEWEAQGTESCTRPGGCLYLISSGRSQRPDYIFAASDSGDDVFIVSSDLLAPQFDTDETPSIYDVRVRGGFATSQASGECLGEACQPTVTPPPSPTQQLQGNGNVGKPQSSRRRCPKGKRGVRPHGKARCVKRHAQRERHHHRKHGRGRNQGRTHR